MFVFTIKDMQGDAASTYGHVVFAQHLPSTTNPPTLLWHEYIHTLQAEGGGLGFWASYQLSTLFEGPRVRNPYEAVGYLWEAWGQSFYPTHRS